MKIHIRFYNKVTIRDLTVSRENTIYFINIIMYFKTLKKEFLIKTILIFCSIHSNFLIKTRNILFTLLMVQ